MAYRGWVLAEHVLAEHVLAEHILAEHVLAERAHFLCFTPAKGFLNVPIFCALPLQKGFLTCPYSLLHPYKGVS